MQNRYYDVDFCCLMHLQYLYMTYCLQSWHYYHSYFRACDWVRIKKNCNLYLQSCLHTLWVCDCCVCVFPAGSLTSQINFIQPPSVIITGQTSSNFEDRQIRAKFKVTDSATYLRRSLNSISAIKFSFKLETIIRDDTQTHNHTNHIFLTLFLYQPFCTFAFIPPLIPSITLRSLHHSSPHAKPNI